MKKERIVRVVVQSTIYSLKRVKSKHAKSAPKWSLDGSTLEVYLTQHASNKTEHIPVNY